jgi:hypothetical protein
LRAGWGGSGADLPKVEALIELAEKAIPGMPRY